jgi:hypothetical protein
LTLVAALGALAQNSSPVGTVVKGFTMPLRNEAGVMEANLTGREAKVLTVNRTRIDDLKIEIYEGEKVAVLITSPSCDFWRADNRLTTRNGVNIEREGMVIQANGMEWEYKDKRGVLRQQVKVTLKNFNLGPAAGSSPSKNP